MNDTKEKVRVDKRLMTKDITLISIFTALIAIGAFITIPIPTVPFTMQIVFVVMAGIMLGPKKGAISVAVYVVMGLIGIPIFTQGGGLGYVVQPTFGYLVAFILSAFVTGLIVSKAKKPSYLNYIIASAAGMAIAYIIGAIYLYCIINFYLGATYTVWTAVLVGILTPLPGNVACVGLVIVLCKKLMPILIKQNLINSPCKKVEYIEQSQQEYEEEVQVEIIND